MRFAAGPWFRIKKTDLHLFLSVLLHLFLYLLLPKRAIGGLYPVYCVPVVNFFSRLFLGVAIRGK